MIKSLDIKNFQSHKETHLEFSPGVNVIVGPTDSGKTAIFRSIKWLSRNRPGGDDFRSTWGGFTRNVLVTDELDTITRIKDKQYNAYFLNEEEFVAFGSDIPEPILEALNLDEINIQEQLDSHFLISSTPGETASYFNRIAHLDQIDSGIKAIQGWLRKLGSQKDGYQENIRIQEMELKRYEFIPKFEARLEVLEGMQEEKEVKGASIGKLSLAIKEIEQIDLDLEKGERILDLSPQLEKILDLIREKEEREAEYEAILEDLQKIHSINGKLRECGEMKKLFPQVTKILDLIRGREELDDQIEDLEEDRVRLEGCITQLDRIELQLEDNRETLKENTPDECPFCGTVLTKK